MHLCQKYVQAFSHWFGNKNLILIFCLFKGERNQKGQGTKRQRKEKENEDQQLRAQEASVLHSLSDLLT